MKSRMIKRGSRRFSALYGVLMTIVVLGSLLLIMDHAVVKAFSVEVRDNVESRLDRERETGRMDEVREAQEEYRVNAELRTLGITAAQMRDAIQAYPAESRQREILKVLIRRGVETPDPSLRSRVAMLVRKAAQGHTPSEDALVEVQNMFSGSREAGQGDSNRVLEEIPRINLSKARAYLERRNKAWIQDKKCLSCHTILPYALSVGRSDGGSDTAQSDVLAYIDSRVRNWDQAAPWYGGPKTDESRATELILNASILSNSGELERNPNSREIFEKTLGLLADIQKADGHWNWLDYHLEPWESKGGAVFGAALAAQAFGDPVAHHDPKFAPVIEKLKGYLAQAESSPDTPVLHRLAVLWAEARMPGILTPERRETLKETVLGLQQSDGGWSLGALTGFEKKGNGTYASADSSDPFSTAFTLMSLVESGAISTSDPAFKKGVAWLKAHQNADGSWDGVSVNKDSSFNHELMKDAATGYALRLLSRLH